jgi:hypothetical protein
VTGDAGCILLQGHALDRGGRAEADALLLLASQRVDTLPSLAIAAVRALPDCPVAVAVPVSARFAPLADDELLELLDELLEELLEDELLEEELDEELLDEELLDDDEPPQLPATDAASFRPLPAPAVASVMHFALRPG